MNQYIVYTPEGYTIAPNGHVEVMNCQMLGTTLGRNAIEAKSNILKDNPWILEAGFHPSKFIIRQLLTNRKHT